MSSTWRTLGGLALVLSILLAIGATPTAPDASDCACEIGSRFQPPVIPVPFTGPISSYGITYTSSQRGRCRAPGCPEPALACEGDVTAEAQTSDGAPLHWRILSPLLSVDATADSVSETASYELSCGDSDPFHFYFGLPGSEFSQMLHLGTFWLKCANCEAAQ